jgi:hypothetical protein
MSLMLLGGARAQNRSKMRGFAAIFGGACEGQQMKIIGHFRHGSASFAHKGHRCRKFFAAKSHFGATFRRYTVR